MGRFFKPLSKQDVRTVLADAKTALQNRAEDMKRPLYEREAFYAGMGLNVEPEINPSGIEPSMYTIRQAIAHGLTLGGWWHLGVGGHREKMITLEVGRALDLEAGTFAVDRWNLEHKTADEMLTALDRTIAYLQ